jgi:penicillin-binding protein activator
LLFSAVAEAHATEAGVTPALRVRRGCGVTVHDWHDSCSFWSLDLLCLTFLAASGTVFHTQKIEQTSKTLPSVVNDGKVHNAWKQEDDDMRQMRMLTIGLLGLVVLTMLGGCVGTRVQRVDERTIIDLSGRWNDTDSQMVADAMIVECLEHAWRNRFVEQYGRIPVVVVGTVFNKTDEHIDADLFIHDLELELMDRGEVKFVSAGALRDEIRAERQGQQEFASAATRKRLREELGADLMLQGTIGKILDMEGSKRVYYYQVDLILSDLETTEHIWIGQKKIKKLVEKSGVGF